MVLKKDADLSAFMAAVNRCEKAVWFDTPEGDHLNLKSALSQFVFAAAIGGTRDLVGSIVCAPEDRERLLPYAE